MNLSELWQFCVDHSVSPSDVELKVCGLEPDTEHEVELRYNSANGFVIIESAEIVAFCDEADDNEALISALAKELPDE